MLTILKWFFSPLGRIVGFALILLAVISFIYGKGRNDASISIKETIERESTKAVTKADTARRSATERFDAGRLRDDGFLRD